MPIQNISIVLSLYQPDLREVSSKTYLNQGRNEKSNHAALSAFAIPIELPANENMNFCGSSNDMSITNNSISTTPPKDTYGACLISVPQIGRMAVDWTLPLHENFQNQSSSQIIDLPFNKSVACRIPVNFSPAGRYIGECGERFQHKFANDSPDYWPVCHPVTICSNRLGREFDRDRNNNQVDINRIREGMDVRTTVSTAFVL